MKSCSVTDIGMCRKMNQDYLYASEIPVGNLPNLFIVADGMGGHNAGEYASMHSIDTIVQESAVSKAMHPVEILENAIRKANQRLIHKAVEDISMWGMGTTVVAAVISGSCLYTANVGDSRLYIVRDSMIQITRDHSYVEEMVRRGEIEREAARNHPDKNIITRAVGAVSEIEIDFFETELEPKDQILICSDGLTNMIEDAEICRIIREQRNLCRAAEELIRTANQNGGRDNTTVIIIDPFSDRT